MNKKDIAALVVGTLFLLLIIFPLAFSFIGLIPFLFSKEMVDYIGVFSIVSVISFACFGFSMLNERKESLGRTLVIFIKSVSAIISVVIVIAGVLLTLLMSENIVKRTVSPDKKYEAYVEEDSVFGGWNVTVYKKRLPGLKSCVNSIYINDMADESSIPEIKWNSDSCDIRYEYYSEFENSDIDIATQKIYFSTGK